MGRGQLSYFIFHTCQIIFPVYLNILHWTMPSKMSCSSEPHGWDIFGTRVLQLWAVREFWLGWVGEPKPPNWYSRFTWIKAHRHGERATWWQELRMTAPSHEMPKMPPPPEPGRKGSPALPQEPEASATPNLIWVSSSGLSVNFWRPELPMCSNRCRSN